MPTHDIIDNRTEKLIDHLNQILGTSERARFAVGYLFLSGLTSVAKRLLNLNELRLLIGNTTNKETVELLAEGYKRLDLAAEEIEKQVYPKRAEAGKMAEDTAGNLRNAVEWMDQTDEAQELIAGLIRMIEEKRLKVRVYTKGRLHAKAYICDYGKVFDLVGKQIDRHEKGIAVVGSSNLTLAGLTHNTELNVVVQGNQNHAELVRWFDDLWKEAQEFDETLMTELKASWAAAQVRPYDIYMKTLYALVRDRLRHPDTQRYKVVQTFLSTGRRCCFLTATPRNKSAWDVYHQIKLFHQDDRTDLPVDPPNLKEYFKQIDKAERKLPDLLANILVRRTRQHILRWYGFDAKTHEPVDPNRFQDYLHDTRKAYVLVGGKHQFFPKRELETIEYSIEDTYQGLYQELRCYLGKARKGKPAKAVPDGELTYARYGLWHYVNTEKQKKEPYTNLQRAGANLRGLMRVLLFKRFESSVYAFRETVKRLLKIHQSFVASLDAGFVPAGEDAQYILYESDILEEGDLVDALREVSRRYDVSDFDVKSLRAHIEHDIELLQKILKLVSPITPDKDAKLQTLKKRLADKPLKGAKRLIFTQYADTAKYLFANLNPDGKQPDIDVIFSGDKSKEKVVGRFAPKANPEYRFAKDEAELMMVIATDILTEGLNLQDCDNIINYDLHWNPVRLIQRFGRIDRIGSEHERIASLRDGIRTARPSLQRGLYVFCQAGRFQQLFLLDEKSEVVSRDVPKVIGAIKCAPDAKAAPLPDGYNKTVMAIQRKFAENVRHREAERTYTANLTHGQLYVLRELRILFEATEDDETKQNVNVLEKVFRGPLTGAVKRELNQLRRNSVTGEGLLKNLVRIYDQHNLKDASARRSLVMADRAIPRIICSEAFV